MIAQSDLRMLDKQSRVRQTVTFKIHEMSGDETVTLLRVVEEANKLGITLTDLLERGRIVSEDNSFYDEHRFNVWVEYQREETDVEYETRLENLIKGIKWRRSESAKQSRKNTKARKTNDIELLKKLALKYPEVAKTAVQDL